jgi:hypothetical protein
MKLFGTNRGSDNDMFFAMMQVRDFTWGAQLFRENAYVLQPAQKERMKILTNPARLRCECRKYLVEGELMGIVKPINPQGLKIDI